MPPLIAISSCRKLEDYRQSILHTGGEVRVIDPSMFANASARTFTWRQVSAVKK